MCLDLVSFLIFASCCSSLPFILSLFLYTCTYTHFNLCIIITIIDRFYIVLFSAHKQTHRAHVACDSEWVTASFLHIMHIFNIHRSGVLTALFGCCMAGAMWNCCCLGTSSVYTIQPCTSLQRDFTQSHIVPHSTFGRMAGIFYMLLW